MMSVRSAFSAQESGRSFGSIESSLSGKSFLTGKAGKFELKRKFYENLSDFKSKVVLHKEPGFVVYRARCSFSGGVVVLKGYSRETLTLQTRQRICTEVGTLQKSQCPFILKCFDSFEDQGWWWLVLENCAAGDLYHIVQDNGPIWEEGWLVSQVLLPLLQTLIYLHAEGIIHRDVKPEHVLFNSEKVAKLSGFFLAQDVNTFGLPKDMVGTLDYVAPEVFKVTSPEAQEQIKAGKQSGNYDYKVDVWMLGVLIYDVLVGRPPFNQETPNATVEHILLQDPEFPDEVSDMAADFVLNCLTKDPAERPTAAQLLAHPWVRENLAWTPPEDFDDIVPDFDIEYYYAGLRNDHEDASDSDSDDGVQMKWYNPLTWHILKPKGTEEFKGEGLRGGISMSVMSFAKKLVNKEDKTKEEQDDEDYLEKKDFKSLEGPDYEKPPKVNGLLKPNKVAPEKFVKDKPPDEDDDEEEGEGEEKAGTGADGKGGTGDGGLGTVRAEPELNGTVVKPLGRVSEEEAEEPSLKAGTRQQPGKQNKGEGVGEQGMGGPGGSAGSPKAAAVDGDFYEAFVKRLSDASPTEGKEGSGVAQRTNPAGSMGPRASSPLAAANLDLGGGERGAAPGFPGNVAATAATMNGAGAQAPLGGYDGNAATNAATTNGAATMNGAEALALLGENSGDAQAVGRECGGAGNSGSGSKIAQANYAGGEGNSVGSARAVQGEQQGGAGDQGGVRSSFGSARAAHGGGGALVGRAAEVAGVAGMVPKASPRGQVLPSLGAASPRGHLPPFAHGAAPQPPSLPPGISPRFAALPVGSPRHSTLPTLPSAKTNQPLPGREGHLASADGAQAHQTPQLAREQLGHPRLSNMVVPFAEDSSILQRPSEQVPSPFKPASVPSGPPVTLTKASPKVPKLALGALASHQQQQQQEQEPQPQGGENLVEGMLPWGNVDYGPRPQSCMAEDLVVESARGRGDKAGVSRSNTCENLENLPQPQRVVTSQQQQRQQQQQQQQDVNGDGNAADLGVGSVLGWGFQLPLDGERSQEHLPSPFQNPHSQSAPGRSASHNSSSGTNPNKNSGTSTTPAMPTVVESPAVSGALPGGSSLGSSGALNNSGQLNNHSGRLNNGSGRLNNSSSQLLTGGRHGQSDLSMSEHGSNSKPNSTVDGQPNSRANSAAQLRLGELAALPRPSSIARHTPTPGPQEPPIPLPPSSRYANPPPATAPAPSGSSAARLMSPLVPPEHPHIGAAAHTAADDGTHLISGSLGEGQAPGASPLGVRPSSVQQGRGMIGSGASGDSAWSAAGRGAWKSQGSSANSHTATNGAVEPKDAWFPVPNDRVSGYVHNSNVDSAEARLNEVHALLGPSIPNTAREGDGGWQQQQYQGSPVPRPGAQGWF